MTICKRAKEIKTEGSHLTKSWIDYNIFKYKKGDAIAYITLYIIIPVVVTIISLSVLEKDDVSIIYCYMTILISALNGMYDGANRWNSNEKTMLNTKIFIILVSNIIVSVYCFCIIMYVLISKNIVRWDWILLSYFLVVIVSLFDAVGCFAKDMALLDCIKKGDL